MSVGAAARLAQMLAPMQSNAQRCELHDGRSGAVQLAYRLRGRFLAHVRRTNVMIADALAFAGVVPGRSVGRGWNSVGPAVAHPAIHAYAAFLASGALSLVGQTHSAILRQSYTKRLPL